MNYLAITFALFALFTNCAAITHDYSERTFHEAWHPAPLLLQVHPDVPSQVKDAVTIASNHINQVAGCSVFANSEWGGRPDVYAYPAPDVWDKAGDSTVNIPCRIRIRPDVPVFQVAVHELMHCLGFRHTDKKGDIMYPTVQLNGRISDDDADILSSLFCHTSE